jgi:hypothetical protein
VAVLAAIASVALTGGCAERQLVARPDTAPSTSTWVAVWLAGSLAAVVLGLLLTLPAWRTRRGARFAVVVLTVQTGFVVLAGLVLAGAGVRSWQLVERPPDAQPAVALLRLSRIDGDTAFLAIMVLLVLVLGALVATVTATAARLAATTEPLGRWIACAVLAVELGPAGYGVVRLVLGGHGWPYLGSALMFPVLAMAIATCWPRGAGRSGTEYNSRHG